MNVTRKSLERKHLAIKKFKNKNFAFSPLRASVGFMISSAEMRLAIIEQIAKGFIALNDPGDWNSDELEEATDAAEEYASTILDMLSVEVINVDGKNFTLNGKLTDVEEFMNSYLSEPLVSDEFS